MRVNLMHITTYMYILVCIFFITGEPAYIWNFLMLRSPISIVGDFSLKHKCHHYVAIIEF